MIRRLIRKARSLLAPPPVAGGVDDAQLEGLLRLLDDKGHPNINPLWAATKDLDALKLNVKMLGYAMAAQMEARLQSIGVEPQGQFTLDSKACLQGDIESRWFRYWCEQLKERPRFHRQLWQHAYLMQGLAAADAFRTGARVLNLGPANSPAYSYLARMGADVTILQSPEAPLPAKGRRDPLYDERFVDWPVFERQVTRHVAADPAAPAGAAPFDALWSAGLACQRGSIAAGIQMIRDTMSALKPGGVAIHFIEFNFADDERTIDDWPFVLFQRRHIEAVIEALTADGHDPSPVDFNVGFQEMDRFIDLPPYGVDRNPAFERLWRDGWQGAHLKTMVDGFMCTAFGLVVRKKR